MTLRGKKFLNQDGFNHKGNKETQRKTFVTLRGKKFLNQDGFNHKGNKGTQGKTFVTLCAPSR